MKRSAVLLSFCLILAAATGAFAQAETNATFLKTKGQWPLPVERPTRIELPVADSGLHDCVMPRHSLYFYASGPAAVVSVAPGTVSAVIRLDTIQAVIVQYADYYLTYANLVHVDLERGQQLLPGDRLGFLAADGEGGFALELLLSKGMGEETRLEAWFRKELFSYVHR